MAIDGGLRNQFRIHLRDFHFQSIEVGFDRGIPDTNYCCEGVEGWIEHKKTNGIKVRVAVEQSAWMAQRTRHGGRTFIAVRKHTKKVDELWLFCGEFAGRLGEVGLSPNFALGTWSGGPGKWDWAQIRGFLLA